MPKIRVALIGVGNVASAFVQACLAKDLKGLWHKRVGGAGLREIELVAAFDIDKRKIGKELTDAIYVPPNVSPEFASVRKTKVLVRRGILKDPPPSFLVQNIESTDTIENALKESGAHVALNLIPAGLPKTSIRYANECLSAGVSFVNATPSVVASKPEIQRKFRARKLVIVGDDLMSQFGGTAFHKGILDFMKSRGIKIEKSYQLDVGGGNETLNTISEDVKIEKRDIKTKAIAAEIPYKFETVAGTTDYVDYMGNNRTSYFWLLGKGAFFSDIGIDIYLRTNDGANAANVLLDVVRAVSISVKRGQFGSPREINEYGFKKLAKPVMLQIAHSEFYEKYAN